MLSQLYCVRHSDEHIFRWTATLHQPPNTFFGYERNISTLSDSSQKKTQTELPDILSQCNSPPLVEHLALKKSNKLISQKKMRFKPTLRLLWGAKYGLMWFFFHRKDGGGMQGIRIEKKLKKLALPETNTVHVQHQHFVNQLTVEIHATASRICRWIFQSGICSLWTSDLMRDFFRRLYHLLEKKIYKMSRSQIPLNPKGSLPFFSSLSLMVQAFFWTSPARVLASQSFKKQPQKTWLRLQI